MRALAAALAAAAGAAATPAAFFAGQTWVGTYQTAAFFRTNTTSFHTCGSEILTVPNVTLAFGPDGEVIDGNVSMPVEVGEFPGETPSLVTQVFAGRFTFQTVQQFPSARDADFEFTVAMAPVEVDTEAIRPRTGVACIKLASQTMAGGYRALRYVERGGVSSGAFGWGSCPSLSADVDCTSSRQLNVIRAFPRAVAWHAEPWSTCTSPGNRTREVSCRDEYGNVASGCSGEAPASWEPCSAVVVPAALAGRWVVLLQTFDAVANGSTPVLLGPGSHALAVAELTVEPSNATALAQAAAAAGVAAPSLPGMVLHATPALIEDPARTAAATAALARPPGTLDASSLGPSAFVRSPTMTAVPSAAAATLTGAAGGVLQGRNASGRALAVAYAAGGAATAGATEGLDAGASGMAVAWTPGVASSAAAFGAVARESRSATTSDADAAARLSPQTAVLAGLATRAPVSYVVQPLGQCLYDPAQNRCERRRPAPRCRNGAAEAVDTAFCALQERPAVATEAACDGCLRWSISDWTACTEVCGGGARTRTVVCLDASNATAPDAECIALLGPKPAASGACNVQPCADYLVGAWGSCSRACGDGVQSRTVTCVDQTGPAPASRCLVESSAFPAGPPNSTRPCNNCPCEDPARTLAPLVIVPPSITGQRPGLEVSAPGSWSPLTSAAACPAGQEPMTLAQWRCYPAAAAAAMCDALNAAAAPRILPFAFRTGPADAAPALPRFLPRPAPGAPAPDLIRVRPDPTCLFLPYDHDDSAFADVSRQAAVVACRASP